MPSVRQTNGGAACFPIRRSSGGLSYAGLVMMTGMASAALTSHFEYGQFPMRMPIRVPLPVVFAAAVAVASLGSTQNLQAASAANAAAAAKAGNWAEKMFNKTKHDFGVVARGADAQYRFTVKNIYKETIHISEVKTTCGCSAAKPTKRTLKTYETCEIVVTMDTKKFIRRKDSNLIVTFDQPVYAQVRIPITAYIRTDVVITPGSLAFGSVEVGKKATKSVNIAYAGRSDWKIEKLKINNKHLKGDFKEVSRSNGRVNYSLEVTLDDKMPAGVLREQVILVTDDANNPYVPVMVQGRVESDITVTVSPLGNINAGKPKNFNVVIRGRKPFKIEGVECPDAKDCFEAKVSSRKSMLHIVPMTFTPKEKAGPFKKTLKIKIAGREQTVDFIVTGQIAAN